MPAHRSEGAPQIIIDLAGREESDWSRCWRFLLKRIEADRANLHRRAEVVFVFHQNVVRSTLPVAMRRLPEEIRCFSAFFAAPIISPA